ncbi:hypothetical protein HUN08_04645 [Gordonia sp. X0973]|uniref:hypothetical protein n=1 Tax=Gordonia sp. X0973 TaxID=2742602 RepID=UPI000F546ED0|nr:hypothetical protein [Gordonia sp. X0973]QKT06556.1 hypothetical protein HUN08_04645 [Gordonia sp. X0973]
MRKLITVRPMWFVAAAATVVLGTGAGLGIAHAVTGGSAPSITNHHHHHDKATKGKDTQNRPDIPGVPDRPEPGDVPD